MAQRSSPGLEFQCVSGAQFQWRSYSLLNPQFQSFKLLLGHALQSHRCGQIQSGNVFYFVAVFYLATELLYFRVSAHFQEHFIRFGDGQGLFNQAMLDQNAMIRRYCQRRWMGWRRALAFSWVFHCSMLTRGHGISEARTMKITTIAAKLRDVAVDMEVRAAMDGDLDFPDELVMPFIINAVTDDRLLKERPAVAANRNSSRIVR
jgi:hypothetical protein